MLFFKLPPQPLLLLLLAMAVAAAATAEAHDQPLLRAEPPISPIIKAKGEMSTKSFLENVIKPIDNERRRLTLGKCNGDCDSDSQCSGSLVCCQRDRGDPVPCCPHIGTGGQTDFCAESHCCRGGGGGGGGGDSVDVGVIVCFSGQTTVQVLGKGTVPMKHLQVGDHILTSSNPSPLYEPVYAFGHHQPLATAEFLLIHTNDDENNVLEVTKDHLVFRQGTDQPVRAGTIQVGDQLQPNGAVVSYIGKEYQIAAGIFTPLVPSGNFLVNSNHLRVSSYSALVQGGDDAYPHLQNGTPLPMISQQSLIHLVLTPFRVYCRSSSFLPGGAAAGSSSSCHPSSYTVAGFPGYVSRGIDILTWADQQPVWLQLILLVLALLIFGTMLVVENIVFNPNPAALLSWVLAVTTMIGYRTYYCGYCVYGQRTTARQKVY